MNLVLPLIWLGVVLVGLIGWIMNIINIIHADFAHITGLLVIQVVGIFIAPLGAVLGFFV